MSIEPIDILVAQLAKLPGVGTKSAQRLAYHILDMPDSAASSLADAITNAKQKVKFCSVCGNYTDVEPCAICRDKGRSKNIVCVVQDAKDIFALEKMREFRGQYHALGGAISPVDGIGPDDIRIKELIARIDLGGIEEVIIATNPDISGEVTAVYISRLIKPKGVKVTRIAHGVPIGGSLEYIDEVTLMKAVEGRREM